MPKEQTKKLKTSDIFSTFVRRPAGPMRKQKLKWILAREAGFSYKYYAKRKIWSRTKKQLAQSQRNIELTRERNRADREHAVEEVCKATGWSASKAREKIKEAV